MHPRISLKEKKSAIPGPIATSCEIVNSHAGREMSQGRSLGDDKPEVGSGWQMARVLAHQQMGRCPLNGGIDGARHGNRLAMQMNAFFRLPLSATVNSFGDLLAVRMRFSKVPRDCWIAE